MEAGRGGGGGRRLLLALAMALCTVLIQCQDTQPRGQYPHIRGGLPSAPQDEEPVAGQGPAAHPAAMSRNRPPTPSSDDGHEPSERGPLSSAENKPPSSDQARRLFPPREEGRDGPHDWPDAPPADKPSPDLHPPGPLGHPHRPRPGK